MLKLKQLSKMDLTEYDVECNHSIVYLLRKVKTTMEWRLSRSPKIEKRGDYRQNKENKIIVNVM